MLKYKILPYGRASKSAKALSTALNCRRISLVARTYRGFANHVIINWGSQRTDFGKPNAIHRVRQILNHPLSIINASNKLRCLQLLNPAHAIEFTTCPVVASDWMTTTPVFARTKLSGNSGAGIVVCTDNLVPAPLYTKHFPKTHEFRAHVFHDKLIVLQQKRLRSSETRTSQPDQYVWNHDMGQRIFARHNVDASDQLRTRIQQICTESLQRLELDFGAFDIGYDSESDQLRIFEVNTACGLEGSTVTDYANTFNEYLTTI